jgi:hypothetical protein
MNYARFVHRNPIIQRVRRHTTFATMLRESRQGVQRAREMDTPALGYAISSPDLIQPPVQEAVELRFLSQFPAPLRSPAGVPPTRQIPALAEPVQISSQPILGVPPDLRWPAPPSAQPSVQPKRSGWPLSAIFRKWQDRDGTEKKSPPSSDRQTGAAPSVPQSAVLSRPERMPDTLPLSSPPPGPAFSEEKPLPRGEAFPPQFTAPLPVQARLEPQPNQQRGMESFHPLPVAPQVPSEPIIPVSGTAPEHNDPIWRRLQAILRKHEEKQAPVQTVGSSLPSPERASSASDRSAAPSSALAESPGEVPQSAPPTLSATPLPARVQTSLEPASSPQRGTIQVPSLPSSSPQSMPESPPPARLPSASPESEDPTWLRLQTIMQKHRESPAHQEAPSTIRVFETGQPVRQEGRPASHPTQASPASPVQKSPAAPSPTRPPKVPQINDGLLPPNHLSSDFPSGTFTEDEEVLPFDPQGDQSQMFFPEQEVETEQRQAVPLEASWNVQRQEVKTVPPRSSHAEGDRSFSFSHASLPPEEESLLRQVVQQTKTEQPTDSHVEVILPRRPRPGSPAKQNTPAPPSSSDQAVNPPSGEPLDIGAADFTPEALSDPSTPPLQKSVPDSAPDAAQVGQEITGTLRKVQPAEVLPSQEPQMPNVQKTEAPMPPSSALPLPERAQPNMIPTEIGPLPSDLWQLLRQTPQKQKPAPSLAENISSQAPIQTSVEETNRLTLPGLVNSPFEILQFSPTMATFPPQLQLDKRATHHLEQPSPPDPEMVSPNGQKAIPSGERLPTARGELASNLATTVQLQPAEQTAQQPSIQPTQTETPEEPSFSNEKVNELARQVYAQIRRRLSIDWERTRRK